MDMVTISAELFETDVVAFGNFLRDGCDGERNIVVEQRFAVFDGKDKVVVGIIRLVVGFLDGHARSLIWKPRVSKPSSKVPAASRGAMGVVYI